MGTLHMVLGTVNLLVWLGYSTAFIGGKKVTTHAAFTATSCLIIGIWLLT